MRAKSMTSPFQRQIIDIQYLHHKNIQCSDTAYTFAGMIGFWRYESKHVNRDKHETKLISLSPVCMVMSPPNMEIVPYFCKCGSLMFAIYSLFHSI